MHETVSFQTRLVSGLIAVILILVPTILCAQGTPAENAPADAAEAAAKAAEMAKPLAPADKKFIKEASESLFYELAIVETAQRRNRPVGVGRDAAYLLGAKLHPELQKTYDELSKFAQAKNERVRDELPGVEKRNLEELRAVNIEKFKKEVVELLGKESKILAATFASPSIQHPVLKKIAATHLPILKRHVTDIAQAAR